jgi:P-type Cu+ transporter
VSSAAVTDGASPASRQVGLAIGGMTCAACAARVEKKLNGIDSVIATVNFATGQALVTAPGSVPAQRLIEAVEQAGYHADVVTSGMAAAGAESRAEAAGGGPEADRVVYLRNRLLVAVVFFVPLGDLSVLLSLFPSLRFPGWQWVLVVLAVPVAGWAAWPFHQAALKNARHGAASMDTLVSLGMAGFLNPLIAGAAMAVSSAFVVASSIRLRRFGTVGPPGRSRPAARPAHGPAEAGSQPQEEEALPCPG